MVTIENNGELRFYEGDRELTLEEGFKRLEDLYANEPTENQKIINILKNKYWRKNNETD